MGPGDHSRCVMLGTQVWHSLAVKVHEVSVETTSGMLPGCEKESEVLACMWMWGGPFFR